MKKLKFASDNDVIDADALMAEFDRESNVRHFTGKKKTVIRTLMVAFALYAILTSIFGKYLLMLDNKLIAGLMTWPGSSTGFLGLLLIITFLIFPAYKGQVKKINYIPWYDILCAVGSILVYGYYVVFQEKIIFMANVIGTTEIVFGILGILLLVELCRRAIGIPILCVAGAFAVYGAYYLIDINTRTALRQFIFNLFYINFAPRAINI